MAPMAASIQSFLELIRFSHTVFALPFALLACVFAVTVPGINAGADATRLDAFNLIMRLFAVLLCMVFARSAAMAFNRLVDADIDRNNPRTAGRHIPSGQLEKPQVWLFFSAMTFGFIASCLLFLPNWLPIVGALPVLAWICGYSYAKRFTQAAHLWLGSALALSPICAWLAIRGESVIEAPTDVLPAVWLGLAIALWVAGFDMIYACQDAEFDRSHRLHSVPARFGVGRALRIAAALHLGMLLVLALMPVMFPQLSLGWLFLAGLAVVAALIVRQHSIVRPNDLRRVGEAFFHINAIISIGLCLLTAIDAAWR